jgi:CheY-like chemotaxis protein
VKAGDDPAASPGAPEWRALLAHARHELRTPLNAVIGYSEMLLEDSGQEASVGMRDGLHALHEAGVGLLALVNDLLDPSRFQPSVSPAEAAGAVGTLLLGHARDVVVQSDALRERAADTAQPEQCRADCERIRSAAGALLDLVERLARDGWQAVEHAPDRGRSVSAQIEAVLGLDRGVSAPSSDGPAALLVVDDNEINRDILSRLLQRQGHRVSAASTGQEALARLANGRFDLVLLDILMPGLTGFEVLQRMKADPALAQVPVIFISALDDASGKAQAFRAGGVDYVTKPFQAEEVAARVESQLKISRLQRDLARQNQELTRKNDELVRAQQRADLVFSALTDALPGTVLDGKYRLDEKIGAGGFAVVFRGRHLGLDLPVAIKVFRPMSGNDTPEALERFRQEGIAASRIKHPNAVEILDNGISSTGIAYLVMELMEGRTLAAEMRERGPLSPKRLAEIVAPVCEALAELHAAGIVHRDVTPDNIYLHQGRKGEVVKLLDFGLSKMLMSNAEQTLAATTVTGWVMGTPAYMAPERLLNRPADGRSDVYSLGTIMFRMLSGEPAYRADEGGNYALAMMHLTAERPSVRARRPDVPEELDRLVQRSMAVEPAQRPTAGELAALLAQVAAASPCPVPGTPSAPRPIDAKSQP